MDYNQTIHLPQTDFPMRAGLPKREPEMLQAMYDKDLYHKMVGRNDGKPLFVLHDGPPYANGSIHIGTALNKILKDIIVKEKNMTGYCSPYVPGWDTHGLPIESAILKDKKVKRDELTTSEFREKCKEYALSFVDKQREQFKRLGVLGEWDDPYLTLKPAFEAKQVEIFGKMAEKGFIYKGMKPVYWCPHDQTALADAEIEYADGTHETIVSDRAWRVTESPVTYSSIFGGEDYDATRERTGWMLPGYDASAWAEPLVTTQRGKLVSPVAEPVRVMEEFPVVSIRKTRHGKWLYDMGQNFSGTVQLEVRGKRGQSVQLNTTELFNFECDSITECGGYRGEYRLTYTLRGDEVETWRPGRGGESRRAARDRYPSWPAYAQRHPDGRDVPLFERPAQQDRGAYCVGYQGQYGELFHRLPPPREAAVDRAAAPDVRFAAIYVRHVQPLREDARRHGYGAAAQWIGARHRTRMGQRLRAGAALPL